MPSKLFDLTGKVALVTGGSKGLGLAMARGFAEAGADVVISSRHADELKQAIGQITAGTGTKAKWFVADMTQRTPSTDLAKSAIDAFGKVDILVNNAGSNVPQNVDDMTDEKWDEIVELNLSSCMSLSRAVIPQMKSRQWGRIINISSIMGFVSKAGRGAYSATKSGLLGLSRAMAQTRPARHHGELHRPRSDPHRSADERPLESRAGSVRRMHRLGPLGRARELAGPALFLASDAGSYVTGTTLTVDGGSLAKFG